MKAVINLHPVLTDELSLKLGCQVSDYTFEYDTDVGSIPLAVEPIAGQEQSQSQFHLKDETEKWNCSSYNLRFMRDIQIQNPKQLFGSDGIVGSESEIGLAVTWASKPSNQRGIFVGGSITSVTQVSSFRVTGEFPAGLLRDRVQLEVILFLKKPGLVIEAERHLAQMPGTMLGCLSHNVIHFKGSGSVFPIFSLKEDGPLWRVDCNWGDPRTDSFDEDNVRIILNESHPDYKHTQSSDPKNLTPLMKEIIASALHIIILNVEKQIPLKDIIDGRDIERGSICLAIQYFIKTFDLDVTSPATLASSLRIHLDRKTGGLI